jgi:Uma2 family endonuclease
MSEETLKVLAPAQAPAPSRLYTYDELVAGFPESNQPSELKDGELVMSPAPSPWHQQVAHRFHRLLEDWVTAQRLGEVFGAPLDMVLSPHQATQPDVLFVARDRLGIIRRVVSGPADLVAEVVSLGGRNRDRIEKRDLYEQYGVKEYWIIDPEPKTVEVLTLEAGRYELVTRAGPGGQAASRLLPGFTVGVDALFADLVGEP